MRLLKQVYAIGTFVLLAILVILPVFNVDAGENENFSITVETDKEAYEIGETVDYLIKVKNISQNEAKDLSIIDELPSNIKVISTDGQINGNKINWKKEVLLPEEEVMLHLSIKLNELPVTPPVDGDGSDDNIVPPTEGDTGNGDIPSKDYDTQVTPPPSSSKPDTGYNNFILLVMGIIFSGLGYLLYKVNGKRIGKFFILMVLCSTTFIMTSKTDVNAETISVSQVYNYSVKINDEMIESKITLTANMVFDEDETPEIPEEYPDLLDPDNPKWSMDSDNDGLMDAEEEIFGTNPNKSDTDGDGLLDKFEIEAGLDPLKSDTGDIGITDDQKDLDEDGLTNLEEQDYGTSPIFEDTDGDSLSDYEEINLYFTNPLLEDSDNDRLPDDKEIMLKTDPNNPDTNGNGILDGDEKYVSEITVREYDKDENVEVSVSGEIKGEYLEDIVITNMEDNHFFITKDIPGYFAAPFRIGLYEEGVSQEVTLTFNVKPEILKSRSSNIGLYVYNPELEILEEVTNTRTSYNGTELSVDIILEKYKDYVLLVADEWNEAWHKEILDPNTSVKEFDVVLTLDSSGSMEWNDENDIRKLASINFINKLEGNNRAAVVDFDYWATILQPLTTDKELLIKAINEIDSSGGTDISWGLRYAITALTQNIQLLSLEDDTYHGFEEMKKVLDNGTGNLGNTNVLPSESSLKSVTQNEEDRAQYIILLTDGQSYVSPDDQSIKYAKDNGIKIFTIGLGEEVEEDVLRMIASETGGSYLFATSAEDLNGLFDELTNHIIDLVTDSDGDGIPNYFERNLRLQIGKTIQLDPNNPDTDGDGLSDGFEICGKDGDIEAFFSQYREDNKSFRFNSRPDISDTDSDGIPDGNGNSTSNGSDNNVLDTEAREDSVTEEMLLKFADISYAKLEKEYIGQTVSVIEAELGHEEYAPNISRTDINDFRIKNLNNGSGIFGGFGALAVLKDRNLIISFTGTGLKDGDILDIVADAGIIFDFIGKMNYQTIPAKTFVANTLKELKGKVNNIYITGHSLGGYLSQYMVYQCVSNTFMNKSLMNDIEVNGVTFGSARFTNPGAIANVFTPLVNLDAFDFSIFGDNGKYKDYLKNYRVEWDPISSPLTGFNLGVTIELEDKIDGDFPAIGPHSLYNFYGRVN